MDAVQFPDEDDQVVLSEAEKAAIAIHRSGIHNSQELAEARELLKYLVDSNPHGEALDATYDLEVMVFAYEAARKRRAS